MDLPTVGAGRAEVGRRADLEGHARVDGSLEQADDFLD